MKLSDAVVSCVALICLAVTLVAAAQCTVNTQTRCIEAGLNDVCEIPTTAPMRRTADQL